MQLDDTNWLVAHRRITKFYPTTACGLRLAPACDHSKRRMLLHQKGKYLAIDVIRLANSGLSLTTPSSLIVKSAGCNASDLRKASTARSTFGRSGSIRSNTKAGQLSHSKCVIPVSGHWHRSQHPLSARLTFGPLGKDFDPAAATFDFFASSTQNASGVFSLLLIRTAI